MLKKVLIFSLCLFLITADIDITVNPSQEQSKTNYQNISISYLIPIYYFILKLSKSPRKYQRSLWISRQV